MLTPRSGAARSGVTLVELLVTMAVGGIALSLVTALCVRQQRVVADLAQASAISGQLRDAGAILPIDIRALASASGDIREARDTSLEVRATIASGVVCDTIGSAVSLAPTSAGVVSFAAISTAIEPGDSLWRLIAGDSTETWTAHRVNQVLAAPASPCAARGPELGAEESARRIALVLDGASSAEWIGTPVRITRPLRYSLYRSSDGTWSLGERDWNSAAARFNTIQPVAGPFLAPSSRGLHFEYFDSAGLAVAAPVADPRVIALMRVELRGQTKSAPRVLTTGAPGARIDSLSMWVLLRNRR